MVKSMHAICQKSSQSARSKLFKQLWSAEEDQVLEKIVQQQGPGNWAYIAKHLPTRIGKQCRERWYNHLCPSIKKTEWSLEEKWVLFLGHSLYSSQWRRITQLLPGRTDNSIKNCWNSSMKRLLPDFQARLDSLIANWSEEQQLLTFTQQRLVKEIINTKNSSMTICCENLSQNSETQIPTAWSSMKDLDSSAKSKNGLRQATRSVSCLDYNTEEDNLNASIAWNGPAPASPQVRKVLKRLTNSDSKQQNCFMPLKSPQTEASYDLSSLVLDNEQIIFPVTKNVICFDFDKFF